jgi:MarR-like DNA-binding transcriptional regulator SgrR of sgrS sRNA
MKFIHTTPTKIVLLLVFIILNSCNKTVQDKNYYKFVYDYPNTIDPLKAVTEVEIWLTQILYRKLVSLDPDGTLANDLAKSITKTSDKIYIIELHNQQTTENNIEISADMVSKNITRLIRESNTPYAKNIKTFKVLSKLKLEIELHQANDQFIKQLSLP